MSKKSCIVSKPEGNFQQKTHIVSTGKSLIEYARSQAKKNIRINEQKYVSGGKSTK